MLFWAIGVLSVILGFSVAIYLVFEKYDSSVTGPSIFITAASGIVFSLITGIVMVLVVWPPVTIVSWLIFAAFAAGVSALVLTGNKNSKEFKDNSKSINSKRVDLRSGTGN